MILRFRQVVPGLFRGGNPSPSDILQLKKDFGINKIVSLDESDAKLIDRTCKMLKIKHVTVPIEPYKLNSSLLKFLKHDIKKLLLDDGPTFLHCHVGKDRTGFAVALFKCKYLGEDPEKALEEAKSLGFGTHADPKMIHTFEKLIRNCKPITDINNVDIVSNEREYISDNRDSFLDEGHQGSFAPYISSTKEFPYDSVYNELNEQSNTRENYKSIKEHNNESKNTIPMVGTYNNSAGIHGAGPAEPVGGFMSE